MAPRHVLSPSTKRKMFLSTFLDGGASTAVVTFRGSLLANGVLSCLCPRRGVQVRNFRGVRPAFGRCFSITASGVPFNSVTVFSPVFGGDRSRTHHLSTGAVRGCFFMGKLSAIESNNVMTFVASRKIVGTPLRGTRQRLLVRGTSLLSTVHLPGGLFERITKARINDSLVILRGRSNGRVLGRQRATFLSNCAARVGAGAGQCFRSNGHIVCAGHFLSGSLCKRPTVMCLRRKNIANVSGRLRQVLARSLIGRLGVRGFVAPSGGGGKSLTVRARTAARPPLLSLCSLFNFSSGRERTTRRKIARVGGRQGTGQRGRRVGSRSVSPVETRPFSKSVGPFCRRNALIRSGGRVKCLGGVALCSTMFRPVRLNGRRRRGTLLCVSVHSGCRRLCSGRTRLRVRRGLRHCGLGTACSSFTRHFKPLGGGRGIRLVLVSTYNHSVLSLRQIRGGGFVGTSVFGRPIDFSASALISMTAPRRTLTTSLGVCNRVGVRCVRKLCRSGRRLVNTLGNGVFFGPLVGGCRVGSDFVTNGIVRGTRRVGR